jgi:hypothetical protein
MASVQLTISLTDGKVDINGPLNDKGLCYMLLELARDGIQDFAKRQADVQNLTKMTGPVIEGEIVQPIQPAIQPVDTPRIIVPGLKIVPKNP